MSLLRQQKIANLIQELAAQFFEREKERDILITVTRADVSSDLKNASIYVTVMPEEKEEEIFGWIQSSLKDLRRYLGEHMKTKFTPEIRAKIDKGERARQRIEEIVQQGRNN